MTELTFDDEGVDVVFEGTEFRLSRDLIEGATGKRYLDVTDHEVLRIVEKDPDVSGQARKIEDIIR